MTAGRLSAAYVLLGWLFSCAEPPLVTAPRGPEPEGAPPVRVDYPPPPAKIEEIPLSRRRDNPCVWRDGYWDWTGRRWEWQTGRAVIAPAGCLFSELKLAWTTDSLSFYRPAWYPDPARRPRAKSCAEVACIPPANARAGTPP